jgi:23S rRNA pseudouridine1911/1915/1917 synthase
MNSERIDLTADQPGERLDKTLMAHLGERMSRAQLQALIEQGLVLVNDRQVKAGHKLKGGEQIAVTIPLRETSETVQPESIPLVVLYEDDDLAVIDKPAGMVVHPGDLNESGTLVSALLHHWPQIASMNIEEKRAGIVHRLDKDTSGLIVIAKNDRARRHLTAQFQARSVEKIYLALLEKRPQTLTGRIDVPIGRDPKQRKKMAVLRDGRPAISEFTVIDDRFTGDFALVQVRLLTGRTHQIRVHMAYIGCPIVGDRVYGFRKQRIGLKRQFLHASQLAFDHPTSGQRLRFESPLPAGLQNILDKLRV